MGRLKDHDGVNNKVESSKYRVAVLADPPRIFAESNNESSENRHEPGYIVMYGSRRGTMDGLDEADEWIRSTFLIVCSFGV